MHHKKNITLMYFIVFLQGLVFYGAIATIYRQAKGLSMTEIFMIESVSWVLMLLLEVPWGWFADRFGCRKTIIIANIIFFLSKLIFFAASSFSIFLIERVLLSIALSGLSGCDITLLYLSRGEETDNERLFARYRWCSTGGLLAASLLSPLILKISMEATAFWTILPYAAAAALSFFLVDVRGRQEEKRGINESLKAIFKNRSFLLFVVSAALITETVQSVTVFLNQVQYIKSGIDMTYFGFLLALTLVIRLITVKSHWFSRRFGKVRSVGVLFAVILLGIGCLAFTSSPALSIVLIGLVGGSMALAEPIILDIQNSSIRTRDRATILSAYSMCGSVIAAAVNPFIGIGADTSVRSGFMVCALLSALACALLLLYIAKAPKQA